MCTQVKYTDFTASWSIQIAPLRSWYLYLHKELISATDDLSFSTAHANSQHPHVNHNPWLIYEILSTFPTLSLSPNSCAGLR